MFSHANKICVQSLKPFIRLRAVHNCIMKREKRTVKMGFNLKQLPSDLSVLLLDPYRL